VLHIFLQRLSDLFLYENDPEINLLCAVVKHSPFNIQDRRSILFMDMWPLSAPQLTRSATTQTRVSSTIRIWKRFDFKDTLREGFFLRCKDRAFWNEIV
jgi:hypothetical protein